MKNYTCITYTTKTNLRWTYWKLSFLTIYLYLFGKICVRFWLIGRIITIASRLLNSFYTLHTYAGWSFICWFFLNVDKTGKFHGNWKSFHFTCKFDLWHLCMKNNIRHMATMASPAGRHPSIKIFDYFFQ